MTMVLRLEKISEEALNLSPRVSDLGNLRIAFERVARNSGSSTPGVDGINVRHYSQPWNQDKLLFEIRRELLARNYLPSPVLRKWVPKSGKPGELRGLGIPTFKDRVVQAALYQVLEPIFEAKFLDNSIGFRPKRGAQQCIPLLLHALSTGRNEWIIEGDIQACFDSIDHEALLRRLKEKVKDPQVIAWVHASLKAGVFENGQITPTSRGVPQGGILSPLLCNIALCLIEERYQGLESSYQVIRYADDFLILCSGDRNRAENEKAELAKALRSELGLELSPTKTAITALGDPFRFLGYEFHFVPSPPGWLLQIQIPLDKQIRLREKILEFFRTFPYRKPLSALLEELNDLLVGFSSHYRMCESAREVFARVDQLSFNQTLRWLKKKHRSLPEYEIYWRYGHEGQDGYTPLWADEAVTLVRISDFKLSPIANQLRRVIPRAKPKLSLVKPREIEKAVPNQKILRDEVPGWALWEESCTDSLEKATTTRKSA